jgi:transposase
MALRHRPDDEEEYLPDDEEARNHPLCKEHKWKLHIVKDEVKLREYDGIPPKRTVYLCPDCGGKGDLKEWRWNEKKFIDLPRAHKNVQVWVRLGTFRCPNSDCSRSVFTERRRELDHRHHLTRELSDRVMTYLRTEGTFSSLAAAYALKEGTLRSLEEDFVEAEDKRRVEEQSLRLPHELGMHSFSIAKKNCCLLANIAAERILEVITSQNPQLIMYKVKELFDEVELTRVAVVAMPAISSYREVAESLFPQAKIIVPRSEVESLLNKDLVASMQLVGKQIGLSKSETVSAGDLLCYSPTHLTIQGQRKLKDLLSRSDVLKSSHERKQNFLRAYSSDNKQERLGLYERWRQGVPKTSATKSAIALLRAEEWKDAVIEGMKYDFSDYFAQFEHLMIVLRKRGRGYSPARLRGRLVYGDGFQIKAQWEKFLRSRADGDVKILRDEFTPEDQGCSIKSLLAHFETMLS